MTSDQEGERLTLSERSSQLLELILNAERDTQSWIKFLLAIESAIAVALGYLLKEIGVNSTSDSILLLSLGVLLPAAGIAAAVIVGSVILRQRKWHTWYVQKFNELPGLGGTVFANVPGVIDRMPVGYIARRVRHLQICLIVGWVLVGLGLWFSSMF